MSITGNHEHSHTKNSVYDLIITCDGSVNYLHASVCVCTHTHTHYPFSKTQSSNQTKVLPHLVELQRHSVLDTLILTVACKVPFTFEG